MSARDEVMAAVRATQGQLLATSADWRPELMVVRAREVLAHPDQDLWSKSLQAVALLLTAMESAAVRPVPTRDGPGPGS